MCSQTRLSICIDSVMTGVEATRTIRESTTLGPRKTIPIIAVTAHTQPGDRERFLAAGMDDYLGKPVEMEDLQKALEKCARHAA